jgi:PHD/YefM family antitoxin component YafN of YafNO toxin-antitoxin module
MSLMRSQLLLCALAVLLAGSAFAQTSAKPAEAVTISASEYAALKDQITTLQQQVRALDQQVTQWRVKSEQDAAAAKELAEQIVAFRQRSELQQAQQQAERAKTAQAKPAEATKPADAPKP